jgi:hypothetical protein
MKSSLEIKLKEEKKPTLWESFVAWLNSGSRQPVLRVPEIKTDTDILLSQTQQLELKKAVESPTMQRDSDSAFIRRSDSGDGLII